MNTSRYICIAALVFAVLLPHGVHAARIRLVTVPDVQSGGITVDAIITPGSDALNVVEGIILFQGTSTDALSVAVETSGSILSLWPVAPHYDESEKTIRFTGGAPGGFSGEGRLFRMRLTSQQEVTVKVALIGGAAYLNDGKGTLEPVSSQSLTLEVLPDADTMSPLEEQRTASTAVHMFPASIPGFPVILGVLLLGLLSLIGYVLFIAKK